jgi:hypothetical protein
MAPLDFANRTLQNRTFKGQDLTGANFSNADLRGCNFDGASLVGANLQGIQTGQSLRQTVQWVVLAIAGLLAIIGICTLIAQISMQVLDEQTQKIAFAGLPFLMLILQFFRDSIMRSFPRVANICTLACILGISILMGGFTLGLAIIGLTGGGLFLLVIMVVFGAIDWMFFRWFIQDIQSQPGTSFRKANLTDANLSDAYLQNADLSMAVLTGACVSGLMINRHSRFVNTYCEHLYLAPGQQKRCPEAGTLQPGELDNLLAQFNFNPASEG